MIFIWALKFKRVQILEATFYGRKWFSFISEIFEIHQAHMTSWDSMFPLGVSI